MLFSEGRMEEREKKGERAGGRKGRRGRQLALGHTSVLQMCPLPLLESEKRNFLKKGKLVLNSSLLSGISDALQYRF